MNFDILEKYNIKESKINKVNQGYINDVWDITTLENRFILNLCQNIIKNISGEL